ncbi:DUF6461 domain-containing protein [Streptomyces olivaceoviridis]|uniref:DUF6461 domain-containing protein n=1 Tax=Streptomyces olivaceoviridis TaxID=1921 RepID=UPI0033BD0692
MEGQGGGLLPPVREAGGAQLLPGGAGEDGGCKGGGEARVRGLGVDAACDESVPDVDGKAAVLALAERLTGIRLTESLLQDARYELGLVPEQPAEEWTSLVIDITDAQGERLHREWSYEEIAAASDRVRAEANAPVVITYNEPPAIDRSEYETRE